MAEPHRVRAALWGAAVGLLIAVAVFVPLVLLPQDHGDTHCDVGAAMRSDDVCWGLMSTQRAWGVTLLLGLPVLFAVLGFLLRSED